MRFWYLLGGVSNISDEYSQAVYELSGPAELFPVFCSLKRLGVFLLPHAWIDWSIAGLPHPLPPPPALNLYTWVERGTVRVLKCFAQECSRSLKSTQNKEKRTRSQCEDRNCRCSLTTEISETQRSRH